jgi:uncharacterized membrane protein YkoI
MRRIIPAALLSLCAFAAHPVAAEEPERAKRGACLDEAEIHAEVGARRVVSQVTALRAARAAKGGEPVRARLCRGESGLVYAITSLKKDGKVVHVMIDASSGKVIGD